MRAAALIFVAASVFAWLAARGDVRVGSSGPPPAPIVLSRADVAATMRLHERERAAVRRRVERTRLSGYRDSRALGARP